jgi:segregation and condensation protein B
MGRRAKPRDEIDLELIDLPQQMRWREWMARVEAVIFASAKPVTRDVLARVVGRDCNLDLIIDDIREELRGRPYELVSVAGGWQHRTRPMFGSVIRASGAAAQPGPDLSRHEATVLMAIAYFQPVTRGELKQMFGKEVSRDTIGVLRSDGLIQSGPRSPQPGAPYTYVTTNEFLVHFGFDSLRDLPDMESLEEAGLLSKDRLLAGEFPGDLDQPDDLNLDRDEMALDAEPSAD